MFEGAKEPTSLYQYKTNLWEPGQYEDREVVVMLEGDLIRIYHPAKEGERASIALVPNSGLLNELKSPKMCRLSVSADFNVRRQW